MTKVKGDKPNLKATHWEDEKSKMGNMTNDGLIRDWFAESWEEGRSLTSNHLETQSLSRLSLLASVHLFHGHTSPVVCIPSAASDNHMGGKYSVPSRPMSYHNTLLQCRFSTLAHLIVHPLTSIWFWDKGHPQVLLKCVILYQSHRIDNKASSYLSYSSLQKYRSGWSIESQAVVAFPL